jgi:hypothetical protein
MEEKFIEKLLQYTQNFPWAQVHLIYDLQLMMSGKSVQVSPDEYISCALSIFLDIINIFLMILAILGGGGCNN